MELIFIPFSVASFTTSDSLDGNTKTNDSSNSSLAVGDESYDSSSGTIVVDDTSTDSSVDTSIVDDTTMESNDKSYVEDNTSTKYSNDILIVDDTFVDSSNDSLVGDDNLYYAPNERTVSTDEIVSISENSLGDLSSGIEKEVKIEYFEDIDSVKLTPATDLEEVKVTIIKLKDKPEEIIDPLKKNVSVYKYLDIKLIANDTYVEEDEINSIEFKFKVEKNWINEYKIDKATIKMIRYHDGVWQNLSTTLNSENESYIYCTAVSPGFSTFAVVGSKIVEKNESYGSDDVSIPWSIIFAFIMALTITLVFILIKARYIYLKDNNK